jgi:hypothetical protein
VANALDVVLAVFALALGSTGHISFVTLAVLLLTKALPALATLKMLSCVFVDLFLKSLRIALQNFNDSLSALFGEVLSVPAHLVD